ncbi:glycosyltransferase [Kutzneria kofuensis]|uniref:Hopene-associated glycosyltransferase HpnB n=1 Tax=Kutzneria kofuensis TaxID=103725 RepID=A0A7W9KS16_9PSEU|nr:glycosyltransferase [Kutzneria kofuensis]MBB5897595.1 hopene-associated glycosyltransferase HpnB [Kutzneria kofuensis]
MVIVTGVAALAWLYLLLAHGGFWRTAWRLPAGGAPERWPAVVAVVPARDEADILPETLPTLLGQDYPGPFRVVLVDDASTDGTAEAALAVGTGRLDIVRSEGPPPGWAGKVAAMATGVGAASDGEYLLFTDADIAHPPDGVRKLVAAALADDRALVSQMALLRTETVWERLIVPAFVYFFSLLYPFGKVNDPRSRVGAAAGGCMLVRQEALAAAGGLAAIKDALIDDVAFGRLIKRGGHRTWLGLTTSITSRRPYPRLADLWTMVARSAYTQLRKSPLLLTGCVLGLLLIFVAPPLAVVVGPTDVRLLGLLGWVVMAGTYLPMLRFYRLPVWLAPALPVVAVLYTAMTVDSARRHWLGRGGAWKGRTAKTCQ